MLLRRYHDVEQENQAVKKPPVIPADVVEDIKETIEVEEKPKRGRRSKKGDAE